MLFEIRLLISMMLSILWGELTLVIGSIRNIFSFYFILIRDYIFF